MNPIDKKVKMFIVVGVAFILCVAGFLMMRAVTDDDTDGESLSYVLYKANDTHGYIRVGYHYDVTLGTEDYQGNMWTAHIDGNTLVMEKSRNGKITDIEYFPVLAVDRVVYTEDGVQYVWFGGEL